VGEEQATAAAFAEHAAGDQRFHEAAVIAFFFLDLFAFIAVVIPLFLEKASEEEAARAPLAKRAASQQAGKCAGF
jgi:hypothetical protein